MPFRLLGPLLVQSTRRMPGRERTRWQKIGTAIGVTVVGGVIFGIPFWLFLEAVEWPRWIWFVPGVILLIGGLTPD